MIEDLFFGFFVFLLIIFFVFVGGLFFFVCAWLVGFFDD